MQSFPSLMLVVCALSVLFSCAGGIAPCCAQEPDESGNKAAFLTDVFPARGGQRPQVDLSGTWQFGRDKDNQGKAQGWHEGKGELKQSLRLPGVPQAQGIGEPSNAMKHRLDEPFWVRRYFDLPGFGADKRVWLRVGGILPAAEIYLNGAYVGYTRSSRTPQRVDVTPFVKPGTRNLIAIKVCDWPPVKLEGIWEMAELQRVWTGVYRPITLEITDAVSVVDVYAQPMLAAGSVRVSVQLSQAAPEALTVNLDVRGAGRATVQVPQGQSSAQADVKLSRVTPWSPDNPKLYDLEVSVASGGTTRDRVTVRFGMREIAVVGTKFLLNGKPLYLRCFGDDQLYPETLAPPPGKEWYLPRLRRARSYGLNAAKSCEEIFSPEYLEAADEVGLLIVQEMPFGLSGTVRANQHRLEEPWRRFYGRELDGLIRWSRNHPSVIAYSMCSEVPLDSGTQEAFNFFCRECVQTSRRLAPHALAIDNTGYHGQLNTPRGQRLTDFYALVMPGGCKDIFDEPTLPSDGQRPIILHEYNWWSCYPDPRSRDRYRHTPLIPWWLDVLEKTARENGQEPLLPTYRKNSLWLQAQCRKDGLEYARRSPGVEGFVLWLLNDFGQYSEGVLDDFWEPKSTTAAELLKSTGDTVILLAKEGNRCLRMGEKEQIPLAISHYREGDLKGGTLYWRAEGGPLSQRGDIKLPALKQGELNPLPPIEVYLPQAVQGYRFLVSVLVSYRDRTINTNEWSFWAFPEAREELRQVGTPESAGKSIEAGVFLRLGAARGAPIPQGAPLVLADSVDAALAEYVEQGGRCLLFSSGSTLEVPEGFFRSYTMYRTVPWNGGPGNLGTVVAAHPALEAFPHEDFCDLQFAWMVKGGRPLDFEPLRPLKVEPIIRGIDFYRTNRNLAFMLEFNVGKGEVLVTTLNILSRVPERLEARNLLQCLVDYARGPRFMPTATVPKEEFARLFARNAQ